MPKGFRKSLMGFNCEDVVEYIEQSHREFLSKENALKNKITELEARVASTESSLQAEKRTNLELNEKVKEYTDKYDEIERLSQNIGKLYLVAQSNAQSVMLSAEESRAESEAQIEKNLSCISDAHRALEELKERLDQTTESFSRDLNEVLASLADTRASIQKRSADADEAMAQAGSMISSSVK